MNKRKIKKQLKQILQQPLTLDTTIELNADQSAIFQMVKIFTQSLDSTLEDNDVINMIFRNGLIFELNRIKTIKDQIYEMGNLEDLTRQTNLSLTDDEKKIAQLSLKEPQTIDDYWQLGYITIRCPNCQSRAVWHEKTLDYQCLDGCKKAGILETRGDNGKNNT